MRRVMIIGQPGSGKSTFARKLGGLIHLPVYHIDHIHWESGWVERPGPEKDRLCAEIHGKDRWIFEGGRSSTWPERLARADTLIWLDVPLPIRFARVIWRTIRHWGRNRPDLPDGCPEHFSWEFYQYVWRTRHTSRRRMRDLYNSVPMDKVAIRLSSSANVRKYFDDLKRAITQGNLGVWHR